MCRWWLCLVPGVGCLKLKSGVSWIYEDIWGTSRGFRKLSTKREICLVGEPLPDMMGLPGLPGLVNLRQKVESGCSAICGREKLMSLLRKVIVVSHVIQCFLNLLAEIACRIRVKGFIVGTVCELHWRMASLMYYWRSMTATLETLSAGLMMMSLRECKDLSASRCSLGRLSWVLWREWSD